MTDAQATFAAASLSVVATFLAAYATWRGPVAAARLAERLRSGAERQGERQRQKMSVFTQLMQERARIWSENGVRMLNLVDVVFHDVPAVRKNWSELYAAFNANPIVQIDVESRLRKLLSSIAGDVGLGGEISAHDLERVYYPVEHFQEQFIRQMLRDQAVGSLQASQSTPATNPAQNTLWPPRP